LTLKKQPPVKTIFRTFALNRILFNYLAPAMSSKLNWNNNPFVQKLFSVFLLLIFTFSFTPKIYFHDVIANHEDTAFSCDHTQNVKACLHQKGYNPYLIFNAASALWIQSQFPIFNTNHFLSFTQDCVIHKDSRGPPVA
jgi:hypothetical protein